MIAASAPVQGQDMRGSRVSVRVVRGLAEAVERRGGSRDTFLSKAGLDAADLDSVDACLGGAELYRKFEIAMDVASDPALGLHWCEGLSESVFNPITQLVRHAATLRCGLTTMTRFIGLLSEPAGYEVIETADKVIIRTADLSGESLAVQRFVSEMLVIGFGRLVRAFSPRARLEWVGFTYPAPVYSEEYTRALERPAQFDQSFTGVVFDRKLMDVPSPYKDEELHLALRGIAEQRSLQLRHNLPTSWRVREHLVRQGGKPEIDMPAVARALGMSTRSLRRRLNVEGISFHAVAHEASASVAKQLLLRKHASIQDAAFEMGFAHSTTFHRAFKRWTGTTPREFRELHR